jgi:hypothetical protein
MIFRFLFPAAGLHAPLLRISVLGSKPKSRKEGVIWCQQGLPHFQGWLLSNHAFRLGTNQRRIWGASQQ